MTQRQLAKAVDVNRRTVDNWENGRSRPRNRLGALEEVLGTTLSDDRLLNEVFDALRGPGTQEPSDQWSRYEANLEKLMSGDMVRVAEVVRDLWRQAKGEDLHPSEERMLHQARRLLVAELAVVQSQTEDEGEIDAWLLNAAEAKFPERYHVRRPPAPDEPYERRRMARREMYAKISATRSLLNDVRIDERVREALLKDLDDFEAKMDWALDRNGGEMESAERDREEQG